MNRYFIIYDLRRQRDYQPLWAELARLGARRTLESTWCLERSGTTTAALRDHFRRFIDSDDGLLVVQASHWAGTELLANPSDAVVA